MEKEVLKKAIELYESGISLAKAGIEIGLTRRQMSRLFKKNGYVVRRRGKDTIMAKHKQPERKLCSCCGERYVPTSPVGCVILTRLCIECYKSGGDAQLNSSNVKTRFNNDDSSIGWY